MKMEKMKMDKKSLVESSTAPFISININEREKEETKEVLVLEPKFISKIFTEKRLELIAFLKRNEVDSIRGLAKELGRNYKNVYMDLKYLKGLGLIEFRQEGKRKVPSLNKNIKIRVKET